MWTETDLVVDTLSCIAARDLYQGGQQRGAKKKAKIPNGL